MSALSKTPTNNRAGLTVALEAQAVVPLPRGPSAGAQLVGGMALVSQTSVLLASAGQPTQLTVLVHWVYNPVDAGILHHACCCCWPERMHNFHFLWRCFSIWPRSGPDVMLMLYHICNIFLLLCSRCQAERYPEQKKLYKTPVRVMWTQAANADNLCAAVPKLAVTSAG